MKYIKSFADQAALNNYYNTAESKQNYLLRNESGTDGIDYIGSGKKIQCGYKQSQPLTFIAQQANSTVKYNALTNTTAEYSYDNINWTDAGNVTITLANVGDKVYYRGTITNNLSVQASTVRFVMTGKIAASGSIMSMYNKNSDDTVITYTRSFANMFRNCTSLTETPEMPATTVSGYCYEYMYQGCSNLISSKEILAETIGGYSMHAMFSGCSNLVNGPTKLYATRSDSVCYKEMFNGCSKLINAPEIMLTSVYYSGQTAIVDALVNMFKNCNLINYVKVHVLSQNGSYNFGGWLSGAASNGIVELPSNSQVPDSVIPSGWTRVNF